MSDRDDLIAACTRMYRTFLMCVEVEKGMRQLAIDENEKDCEIPESWSPFTLEIALKNEPELLKKAVVSDIFKHNNLKANPDRSWLKVHASLDALCASACVEAVHLLPRPAA